MGRGLCHCSTASRSTEARGGADPRPAPSGRNRRIEAAPSRRARSACDTGPHPAWRAVGCVFPDRAPRENETLYGPKRPLLHRTAFAASDSQCCSKRPLLPQTALVAPNSLGCAKRPLLQRAILVAANRLCRIKRPLLRQTAIVAANGHCCSKRPLLQQTTSVAAPDKGVQASCPISLPGPA